MEFPMSNVEEEEDSALEKWLAPAIPLNILLMRMVPIFLLPWAGFLIDSGHGLCLKTMNMSLSAAESVQYLKILPDCKLNFNTECPPEKCLNKYIDSLAGHIIARGQLNEDDEKLDRRLKHVLILRQWNGVQLLVASVIFCLWLTTIISLILNYNACKHLSSTIMTWEFAVMIVGAVVCLYFSVVQFVYGGGTMVEKLASRLCKRHTDDLDTDAKDKCKEIDVVVYGWQFAAVCLLFSAGAFINQVYEIIIDEIFNEEQPTDDDIALETLGPQIKFMNHAELVQDAGPEIQRRNKGKKPKQVKMKISDSQKELASKRQNDSKSDSKSISERGTKNKNTGLPKIKPKDNVNIVKDQSTSTSKSSSKRNPVIKTC